MSDLVHRDLDPDLMMRFQGLRAAIPDLDRAQIDVAISRARESKRPAARRWYRRRTGVFLVTAAVLVTGAAVASGTAMPDLPGLTHQLGDGQVRAAPISQFPSHRVVELSIAKRADDVEGYWRALIIAGAYRDHGGKETVLRVHSPTEGPGWERIEPSKVPTTGLSEAKARQIISTKLAKLGWKPISVEILHPHGIAGLVVAEVPHPDRLPKRYRANRASASILVFGPPEDRTHQKRCDNDSCTRYHFVAPIPRYDGMFLRLIDPSGNLIFETGWSTRLGEGVGKNGPDYPPVPW